MSMLDVTRAKALIVAGLFACLSMVQPGCGAKQESATRTSKLRQAAASAVTQRSEPPTDNTMESGAEERTRDNIRHQPSAPQPSLADLAQQAQQEAFHPSSLVPSEELAPLPQIDEARAMANGIRKIAGPHLTLFTDRPASDAVEELPDVFDRAIGQWCEYFQIDPQRTDDWRLVGYLVQDRERFERAGLWPADLPPFLHGYQRGRELWLYEQPSDYYRRHLLLHEGTHAFMKHFLGGAGPPWYMEGMAELLATHRWEGNELTLRWFPPDKERVSHWGRVKIIQDDVGAGFGKSIQEVMQYDATAHLEVAPYAWCWAAAAFLDAHPASRDKFRELKLYAPDTTSTFSQRFYDSLLGEWPRISRDWQVFAVNVDYGFDLQRELIEPKATQPLPPEGAEIEIAADRGWQSTGYTLEAGGTYQIDAVGRYQLGNQPKPWWCEPNGITIRYHNDAPLGVLLGAIVDEEAAMDGPTSLVKPDVLGTGGTAEVEKGGALFLRINDSPAELADNAGTLTVRVLRLR